MEGKSWDNAMIQAAPNAYGRMLNGIFGVPGEGFINQQYLVTLPEIYGVHHVPVPASQWVKSEPPPEYYVGLPVENVGSQNQVMPYHFLAQVPSLGLRYSSPLQEYMSTQNDEEKFIKFSSTENMLDAQNQSSGGDYTCAFQLQTEPNATASNNTPARQRRSKEKAYAIDRCRRLRISRWLDALQELLPRQEKRNKEAVLDAAIEHVQHLQHQMKDLCRRRLGCETAGASPLLYVEGHGHYAVRNQMVYYGPLEDKIGKLMEVNPQAFEDLLQSRGLLIMLMAFADVLPQQP